MCFRNNIKCTGIPEFFPKSSVMLIQRRSSQQQGEAHLARTRLSPERGRWGWVITLVGALRLSTKKDDKVDDGGGGGRLGTKRS